MISLIAEYIIFSKMGEAGFKSLIPFYNRYVLYKKTWDKAMFWVLFVIEMLELAVIAIAIRGAVSYMGYYSYYFYRYGTGRILSSIIPRLSVLTLLIPLGIGKIVIKILGRWHLGKSFGGGKLFCVFAIFFPTFFRYILGFDRNYRYIGNMTAQEKPKKQTKETAASEAGAEVKASVAEEAPAAEETSVAEDTPVSEETSVSEESAPAAETSEN